MDRLLRIVLLVVTGVLINAAQVEPLDVYVKVNYSKVCEGDSVTINCSFQPGGKYKVRWYYSNAPVFDCETTSGKIPEEPHFNAANRTSSTLKINSTKTSDSGWYFCQVTQDIPVLLKKCSTGVEVRVEAKNNPTAMPNMTTSSTSNNLPTNCTNVTTNVQMPESTPSPGLNYDQWWIWLAMAVGCIVLVVSIVVICIITRKTEDIIYENTKVDESGCWSWKRNKTDTCNLPPSKKFETIKPLRKYDTYAGNRNRRP